MELLEIRSNRNHGDGSEVGYLSGGLEKRLDGIIDEVGAQMRDQLQTFMVMYTRQNQSSLNGLTSNILESTGSLLLHISLLNLVLHPLFFILQEPFKGCTMYMGALMFPPCLAHLHLETLQ